MFIGIDVYHAKKTYVMSTWRLKANYWAYYYRFEGGDDDKNVYRQRRSIGAFTSSIITPDGRYLTSSHVNPHNVSEGFFCDVVLTKRHRLAVN
jgi:hypothetical protein